MADSASNRTTLVLLHAFPLHDGMWEPQFAALTDLVDIHAPNFPGFGGQPGLDEESFTMDRIACYIQQDLESRGIEHCILGGLSMGGYVAFECWRRFPERIAGLLLADTRAAADDEAGRRNRQKAIEKISAGGYAEYVDETVNMLLSEKTRSERPELVEIVRRIMLDSPAESAVSAQLGMMERADSTALLPTITVPTVVVAGEHDTIPVEEARAMASRIPDAAFHVIDGAGHLTNLENPEQFNDILRDLISAVESVAIEGNRRE